MGQVNALPFFSVMAETKVKTAFLQQAGDWSDQGPVIQHKSARTAEEILGILDCAEGGGSVAGTQSQDSKMAKTSLVLSAPTEGNLCIWELD